MMQGTRVQSLFGVLLLFLVLQVPGTALANLVSGSGRPGVETLNSAPVAGDYGLIETALDIEVKVVGRTIRVTREWRNGRWRFLPELQTLEPLVGGDPVADGFESLGPDALPDAIRRGAFVYELEDEDEARWSIDERRAIVGIDDGYKWQSRSGEWIKFDAEGRARSYGNRDGVQVQIGRDENGRVLRMLDHDGTTAISFEYDGTGRVVSVEDHSGRSVNYEWDGNDLVRVTDVTGQSWSYGYETLVGTRRLTSKTDPEGRVIEYNYAVIGGNTACVPTGSGHWQKDNSGTLNWSGRCVEKSVPKRAYLRSKSNALGLIREYSFADDSEGDRFSRATRTGNQVSERVLNSEGRLIERRVDGETVEEWKYGNNSTTYVDAMGNETRTEVNRFDEIVHKTYPNGDTESWSYNNSGQVVRYINRSGTEYRKEYTESGNLFRLVEAVGSAVERTTTYKYDENGQVIERTRSGAGDTPSSTVKWTYDEWGNVDSRTDPLGYTINYDVYNARGDLVSWRDRAGEEWRANLDKAGRMVQLTDPIGNSRSVEYDRAGKLRARIDMEGNRFEYELNEAGVPVEMKDRAGGVWKLVYGEQGQKITEMTDPDGVTYKYKYNDSGTVAVVTEPDGDERRYSYGGPENNAKPSQIVKMEGPSRTVEYKYDALNRKVAEVVTPNTGSDEQRVTRYTYNGIGEMATITDELGRKTVVEYDALGRRSRINDPTGNAVSYQYNYQDSVVSYNNENGVTVRSNSYNARGDRIRTQGPNGSVWRFDYDPRGKRDLEIDAEGRVARVIHDEAGRSAEIRYYADEAAAEAGTVLRTTEFDRDGNGAITRYSDGDSTARISYDGAGREVSRTVDFGHFEAGYDKAYTAAGRLKRITYPDGDTVGYEYDNGGRLDSVRRGDGRTVNYQYSANRITTTLPGGSRNEWEYGPFGRVKRIDAVDPAGNPLYRQETDYDKAGNMIRLVDLAGVHEFEYDGLDRLTSAQHPDQADEVFAYDAAGNRMRAEEDAPIWKYDDAGQLAERGATQFGYDANGAMIERVENGSSAEFQYDVRQRLEKIARPSGNTTWFSYNPFGQRISRTVNGSARYFLHSMEGLLAVYDEDGNEVKRFGWSPRGRSSLTPISPIEKTKELADGPLDSNFPSAEEVQWQPLWLEQDGATHYYLTNHLGRVDRLIEQSGAVSWAADYQSFGKASVSKKNVDNPIRFPGQYADPGADLSYNHHRYYAPELGRYSRRDPARADRNDYVYARNNTYRYTDRLGLASFGFGGTGSCDISGGAGLRVSKSWGKSISLGGTICTYNMECTGPQVGFAAGCGGSADLSFSTGSSCSGEGKKGGVSCGAKAGAGLSGGVSSNGTGECSSTTVMASGGAGIKAKAACSATACVVTTDCWNEPDCCDTPCECGGCG